MNANFRRDYLYQFTSNHNGGMQEGAFLRYLKFDTKTKEYIFIEGRTRQPDELQLRVLQTKSGYIGRRIKKVEYIGYAETDQYKLKKRVKKLKAAKRPSLLKLETKVLKNSSELEVGKVYKFSNSTKGIVQDRAMVLESLTNNYDVEVANFKSLKGDLIQTCVLGWIDHNHLTCTLIG